MSAGVCGGRQPLVLHCRTPHWLVCLLLGGVLVFSGCGFGHQGATINDLNGIVALSASDVWAVGWASGQGSSPLIEHWDGRAWTLVPAPGKGDKSFLISVAASSAQDVWAVGDFFQGSGYETLIEHWNGTSWRMVPSPNDPGGNVLRSVAVVSATDVWAVGETDPCPTGEGMAPPPSGNALVRLHPAAQVDTCTAAGSHPPPPQPLIEHWDGHVWRIVPSPNPIPHPQSNNPSALLSDVVALSANAVWASGTYSDRGITPADGAALVEEWDGTAWRIRTDFDAALVGRTWATAFFSSSDIWGVEYATSPSEEPTFKHWNGDGWSVEAGPGYGAGGYFVGAMAASASADLWAVGNREPPQQDGHYDQVFAMSWDGRTWSLVPCPSPAGGYIRLAASASLSPNDAWMVGQYSPSDTTQLTFLEHWDGHAWSLVPNPNPAQPAPTGQ